MLNNSYLNRANKFRLLSFDSLHANEKYCYDNAYRDIVMIIHIEILL